MIDKRANLIYLVPFKKHIPDFLLVEVFGFNTLNMEIPWLSFLDKEVPLGFLDRKIF